MREARPFPAACVASPHELASAAGLAVLAGGGNAVDAAIAANLVLAVVTPYHCGPGGDLFALVWRDGLHAYNGSGRAPAGASIEAVRERWGGPSMPQRGPLTVTVPGAVEGWFALLERFGSRPFDELARPAVRYAREGFVLSGLGAGLMGAMGASFPDAAFGDVRPGSVVRQPGLARTLEVLGARGPDAFYRGEIAEAAVRHLRSLGSPLTEEDLDAHRGEWVTPLRTTYRDLEVVELPPNTQGVTALEALNIVEGLELPPPGSGARHHLLVEATKLALADRDAHLADPDRMRVPAEELASKPWAAARRAAIDPGRARSPAPLVPAAGGGTAYLCAADADGTCVSLIQSNYGGSGVTVPGWGIYLHNRGAAFSLDPAHPAALGPRRRPPHTLIPAMALRGGRPVLMFGTMGADGQPQTHLQLLVRWVDDREDLQRAVDAPRWRVLREDWTVLAEPRLGADVLGGLRSRGHRVVEAEPYDHRCGHAHAIALTEHGYLGATDPRTEGAVLGL